MGARSSEEGVKWPLEHRAARIEPSSKQSTGQPEGRRVDRRALRVGRAPSGQDAPRSQKGAEQREGRQVARILSSGQQGAEQPAEATGRQGDAEKTGEMRLSEWVPSSQDGAEHGYWL